MNYVGGIGAEQLKSFVERIERLEEEKTTVAETLREVFAEARANGFDVKILRQVLKLRKLDHSDRQEQEELLDLYMHALGMVPSGIDTVSSSILEDNNKEGSEK